MATIVGAAARRARQRPSKIKPRAAVLNSTSPAASSQRPGLLTQPGRTIKLYPELSIAALKAKWHKEIALWYQLRALTGSGGIPLERALSCLVPSCYTQATFYRTLTSGKGLFWDHHPPTDKHAQGVIRFHGILKVAELLGVTHISGPREIPASSLLPGGNLKAQLYASFHHTLDSKPRPPISRQTLEEITGVNRRTQLRYDKATRTRRVPNYADQENPKGELYPQMAYYQGKRKIYPKHRRLGNSYYARAHTAARGILRRVNRLLAKDSLPGDEGSFARRFFTSPKSFIKQQNRHAEPFLLCPATRRYITGRKEWIALTA